MVNISGGLHSLWEQYEHRTPVVRVRSNLGANREGVTASWQVHACKTARERADRINNSRSGCLNPGVKVGQAGCLHSRTAAGGGVLAMQPLCAQQRFFCGQVAPSRVSPDSFGLFTAGRHRERWLTDIQCGLCFKKKKKTTPTTNTRALQLEMRTGRAGTRPR